MIIQLKNNPSAIQVPLWIIFLNLCPWVDASDIHHLDFLPAVGILSYIASCEYFLSIISLILYHSPKKNIAPII